MGFERNMARYRCGCYSEEISHDSFNYTADDEYRNVCGKHPTEESAKEEHRRLTKVTEVLENARDALITTMDTDRIAHYLTIRKVISKDQRDNLLKCTSKSLKAQKLINMIVQSGNASLHHLRMALVKAGQTNLLKNISEIKPKEMEHKNEQDADLDKAAMGRCMIELQGDCHVVAKDHNGQIYINIRNYQKLAGKIYPTKQGVSLTLSRWLLLNNQKDFINNVFKLCLEGEQVDEELIHLGGGVYVTLNSKYPTVDIRHFWKPQNSEKPVATKRGIALNNFKWQKLCDAMTVMTDYVPELTTAVICQETHNNELEMMSCSECYPFQEEEEEEISQNQEGNFQIQCAMLIPNAE